MISQANDIGPIKPVRRLLQLDVLRGIAILLVLFRHPVVYSGAAQGVGFWKPLSYQLYFFGWTGVDLFFVLSGFLIGGLLFQEIRKNQSLDVWRFLIRRGFKIWPPYFALLFVVFFSQHLQKHFSWNDSFRSIVPNLLHLQNFRFQNFSGPPRGFTWSLSVEEHFYLALPLFLLLVLAVTRRPILALPALPIASIVLIVGCTTYRFLHNWNRPYEFASHTGYTYLRIDGLFFGVLLAYLQHFHGTAVARVARHRNWLLLIGLALLAPMMFLDAEHRFVTTFGYTMLYLGYGTIMMAAVYTVPGKGVLGAVIGSLPGRAIAFVGVYSYSIYLWQEDLSRLPIIRHVLPHLARLPRAVFWPTAEAIHLACAIAGGFIMARLIEMPSLAIRDRIFPPKMTPRPADPEKEPIAQRVLAAS